MLTRALAKQARQEIPKGDFSSILKIPSQQINMNRFILLRHFKQAELVTNCLPKVLWEN